LFPRALEAIAYVDEVYSATFGGAESGHVVELNNLPVPAAATETLETALPSRQG
jgi:hypothetical protein